MKYRLSAQEFERQVERIYRVLETTDSRVTWDARILDSDLPNVERQIDVLVEKGGKRVAIECRHRKKPQDIQWIEHLVSKKKSVKVDSIIGVSSSGFTNNATRKAKACGVIVRDLREVPENEISTWSNFRKMTAHFIEFYGIELFIDILKKNRIFIRNPSNLVDGTKSKNPIWELLNRITIKEGDSIIKNGYYENEFRLNSDNVLLDCAPVVSAIAELKARPKTVNSEVLFVGKFTDARPTHPEDAVVVERTTYGQTELISGTERVMWTVDFSAIICPRNCIFHDFRVESVTIPGEMMVDIIGADSFRNAGDLDATINIKYI